jgi:hypothetical protein
MVGSRTGAFADNHVLSDASHKVFVMLAAVRRQLLLEHTQSVGSVHLPREPDYFASSA